MTYLLDTATLLWAVAAPDRLSARSRKLIEAGTHTLVVSIASLWEITVKAQKGLLAMSDPVVWLKAGVSSVNAELISIHASHVYALNQLPDIHRDPFDRILIAQALTEGWPLITSDATVRRYPAPTVW